ncbi:hypothetical protein HQ533_01195 [Candidatus Woesearchaeota archaeon]|nr:hypothetical protein [Candidatus Woesearchaeota archaeon]
MDSINEFISKFTDKKINGIVKIGREYFFVQDEQKKLREKIGKEVFSMGIFLGEKKKIFEPSPALIDMIAKLSDKKVFISKKAEWLFLCGRDVFMDSIVKKNTDSGLVLVQNEKNENLGYGKLTNKGVKNILDKGNYLRREN